MGTLINDASQVRQPVMGHPPINTSDISLQSFLTKILEFNSLKVEQDKKGVKLDFKSIDAFEDSLDILKSLWETV